MSFSVYHLLAFVLSEESISCDQCILLAKLLAFSLLHFLLQSQTCLWLQVSLDILLFLQCKKAKWLSEEALQIAVKRREAKKKKKREREKERYTHLDAEFQRIARRDKKAFLSDQCKEIEGKNTMGKTRDLFKKIRDTKGTFHAKMSSKKDRNGMYLTEAEDVK